MSPESHILPNIFINIYKKTFLLGRHQNRSIIDVKYVHYWEAPTTHVRASPPLPQLYCPSSPHLSPPFGCWFSGFSLDFVHILNIISLSCSRCE